MSHVSKRLTISVDDFYQAIYTSSQGGAVGGGGGGGGTYRSVAMSTEGGVTGGKKRGVNYTSLDGVHDRLSCLETQV